MGGGEGVGGGGEGVVEAIRNHIKWGVDWDNYFYNKFVYYFFPFCSSLLNKRSALKGNNLHLYEQILSLKSGPQLKKLYLPEK